MRRSKAARRGAAGAALSLLLAATLPVGSLAATADDLDALRRECIAAARETQQRDQAIATLRHQLDLLGRDAEARRRGLDDSRREQARLLGVLEFLARNPPDRYSRGDSPAIDRLRGGMLVSAAVPALRAQAGGLSGEIARIAALRRQIDGRQSELTAAQNDLAPGRARLAELVGQRRALLRVLLPADSGAAARVARLGREAKDSEDLIKRADAATERRDKEIIGRARAALPKEAAAMVTADNADPTRPAGLRAFDPPQSALLSPVSGAIDRPSGAADAAGAGKSGLGLAAPAGSEVVAPFDGRVIYAGGFRDLGLVLIIRHGHGYHSLLAGLNRVDVETDQWVLAGEPVGVMPEGSDRPLYFELRRDGRPVDPQPWLARSEDGQPADSPGASDERNGDQRMRQ